MRNSLIDAMRWSMAKANLSHTEMQRLSAASSRCSAWLRYGGEYPFDAVATYLEHVEMRYAIDVEDATAYRAAAAALA
jgi:type II secretory pathway component PulM